MKLMSLSTDNFDLNVTAVKQLFDDDRRHVRFHH